MARKEKIESAFAGWPKMTALPNSGLHLTGPYENPTSRERALWLWLLIWMPVIPFFLPGLALLAFYPIVRPGFIGMFSPKLDVKIYKDKIVHRAKGKRAKTYSRAMPIEFRVEDHAQSLQDRLKRKNRKTYHEAIEVVMQYGEVRVPIADFNLRHLEQARTLVIRLQNACATVDLMSDYVTPATPEKRRADHFDPAPDIG
jgi:hypothetical protein